MDYKLTGLLFNNNDTVVSVVEFFDNPVALIMGTIQRDAKLIIVSDDHSQILDIRYARELVEWMKASSLD